MKTMKRLLVIVMTMVCCQTFAQSGMHISALFEGKIVPMRQMVETRMRFKADEALVKKIDHLAAADFVADSEKRKDREPWSMNRWQHGKGISTITQMYELAPHGSTNRYLCYKVVNDLMTVIYMEGTVTSLDELREIFK